MILSIRLGKEKVWKGLERKVETHKHARAGDVQIVSVKVKQYFSCIMSYLDWMHRDAVRYLSTMENITARKGKAKRVGIYSADHRRYRLLDPAAAC